MNYRIENSSDGTRKITFDKGYISVIIPTKDNKNTLCVSSQIGCPVGCVFCHTGKLGFKANLSSEEIFEQAIIAQGLIKEKIQSVVFMGMGEPTLNLKNVLSAAERIHKELKVSYNRITISTSCLSNISSLEDIPFNVALSIHTFFDKKRKEITPGAVSIKSILNFIKNYLENSNNKKYVMVEYTMIGGFNDSEKDLKKLLSFKWPKRTLFNLIEFNDINFFKKSPEERMILFKNSIISRGWKCFIRKSRGADIDAACGMLEF